MFSNLRSLVNNYWRYRDQLEDKFKASAETAAKEFFLAHPNVLQIDFNIQHENGAVSGKKYFIVYDFAVRFHPPTQESPTDDDLKESIPLDQLGSDPDASGFIKDLHDLVELLELSEYAFQKYGMHGLFALIPPGRFSPR